MEQPFLIHQRSPADLLPVEAACNSAAMDTMPLVVDTSLLAADTWASPWVSNLPAADTMPAVADRPLLADTMESLLASSSPAVDTMPVVDKNPRESNRNSNQMKGPLLEAVVSLPWPESTSVSSHTQVISHLRV